MNVITLTMNPVLDKNTSTKLLMPGKKLRCNLPDYAPGGGGINVSRAIKKLGGDSTAYILGDGKNRGLIAHMLKNNGINNHFINSGVEIRENLMVLDETTNSLYRFGMPGYKVDKDKGEKVLQAIRQIKPKPDFIVASGSLPPGIDDDFYAMLAVYANKNNIKMVLDTSGPPLRKALEKGVYMIKPNLGEMARFLKKDVLTGMEQEKAANELLENGNAKIIVLSLGAKGAMLAHQGEVIEYITPPTMPVNSTVGAGDSMVAGIVVSIVQGLWPTEAVRYGVAAGTAAAMTPGSELCRKEDTDKINKWLSP